MCWRTGGQGRNKQGHASTSKSRQPTVETAACSIPGPTAVRLVLFHFTGGEAEPCAHTAALESMLLTDTLLCLPLQGQRGWGGASGPHVECVWGMGVARKASLRDECEQGFVHGTEDGLGLLGAWSGSGVCWPLCTLTHGHGGPWPPQMSPGMSALCLLRSNCFVGCSQMSSRGSLNWTNPYFDF